MIRVTRKLFKILTARQKRRLSIIFLMMLIGGLLESLSVSLILPLITAIMNENTWNDKWYAKIICDFFRIDSKQHYIQVLLVVLIVLFVVKNLYLLFQIYIQNTFMSSTNFKMRRGLIHVYLYKPYEFFLNSSSGEILRIISGDTSQAFNLLTSAMGFYTEMIVAVILAITIICMSWQIALSTIGILLVEMLIIIKVIKPWMKTMGTRQRIENAASYKWLLQSLNGIKSIKVANNEKYFEDRYIYHESISVDITRKNVTIINIPRLLIESFTVSGVLSILLVLISTGTNVIDIIPQLSAFMVAAIRLLPSVNRIMGYYNGIPYMEGALDNIIELLESQDLEILSGEKQVSQEDDSNKEGKRITFNKSIRFNHISFKYKKENDSAVIFDEADFEILPGQSIGLVGASGAGKTTAVDLILGLLKPDRGDILVDGVNIEENMADWLKHVAYIPQSIFLLDDSIKANITFGRNASEISDEQVWKAIQDAKLEEFVQSLPKGIDTQIGEAGVRLSGGQKQRIGIARALYSNPEILFFDEATSALDNETEAAIMESINSLKGRKTMIIIAHRLTTIENCDVVYRVRDGKVVREK